MGAAGLVLLNKRMISNIIILSVYVYSAKENTDLTPRCLEMVPSSKRILATFRFPTKDSAAAMQRQMDAANKLLSGLSGENARWTGQRV